MGIRETLPGVTLGLALIGQAAAQPTGQAFRSRIDGMVAAKEADWIAIRRDIHRHPEASGAEQRTAALVAERLRAIGLEVKTGVGGHGVVGLLRGGKPGALVAFRADMDAVPSNDPDPVDFPSLTPGIRHICGHDLHTTVGLALAETLAGLRAELPGTVMFVFQPAEERATGANAMLADGLFAASRPDAIFGVHTAPLPVGRLGTRPGVMMAARDFVTVTLSGSGDLKGLADSARRIIEGTGTITFAQALAPGPEGFVLAQVRQPRSTGPSTWVVEGSLSIASPAARAKAREAILQRVRALAAAGVTVTPVYQARAIAGVDNDSSLTTSASASVRAALGPDAVVPVEAVLPAFSEDFGSFQTQVPGVFFFLGVANEAKGWNGMPHSPGYVADEAAIPVATRAMASVVLDRLGRGTGSMP
jgi:metal-dependent amidase/aminoacylase/carboxypeptidase family protein